MFLCGQHHRHLRASTQPALVDVVSLLRVSGRVPKLLDGFSQEDVQTGDSRDIEECKATDTVLILQLDEPPLQQKQYVTEISDRGCDAPQLRVL